MIWWQTSNRRAISEAEEQTWRAMAENPVAANLLTMNQFTQQCSKTPRTVNDVVFVGTCATYNDYQDCAKLFDILPRLCRFAMVAAHSQMFQLRPGLLENVTDVMMRSCCMPKVPSNLFAALGHRVRSIDLSNNSITDVSALKTYLNECTHLAIVNLSGNKLSQFPREVSAVGSLASLNVSGNQVTELEADDVKPLANLKHLDISYNPGIKEIPIELFDCTDLTRLNLTGLVGLDKPKYHLAKNGIEPIRKYFARKAPKGWLKRDTSPSRVPTNA